MRFYLVLLVLCVSCMVAANYPFAPVVLLQLLYYGGPGLFWGPAWFKPVLFLTGVSLIVIILKYKKVKFGKEGIYFLIMILFMYISSRNALISRDLSIIYTLTVFKLFIAYIIFFNITINVKNFEKYFLFTNLIGSLYLCKSILYSYLIQDSGGRIDVAAGQGGGANYLAMVILMTLPFVIHFSFYEKNKYNIIFIGSFLILFFSVILTGSRAGFIAMLFIILIFLFRSSLNQKISIILFSITFGLVISFYIPD